MLYDRAMLDTHFSHLYFCQSLYTLQRGLPAIAGLLVLFFSIVLLSKFAKCLHHKYISFWDLELYRKSTQVFDQFLSLILLGSKSPKILTQILNDMKSKTDL